MDVIIDEAAHGEIKREMRGIPTRYALLIGVLLVAACGMVYFPILNAHFLNLDDGLHVYRNPYFHPLTAHHLKHFWTHAYEGLYVPLSYMLFAALLLIAKPTGPLSMRYPELSANPHVFHAASLVLHTANVLLVFALLIRFTKRPWAAGAGALLFAIHPLQVESVAWISELRGLLSNFFALLAIFGAVCFAQDSAISNKRRIALYTAASLAYAAALLSKPSVVVVPLIILIVHSLLLKYPLRKSLLFIAPWSILSIGFLFLTRSVQGIAPETRVALWQRPLVACDALLFYVAKLVWPTHLVVDYGRMPQSVVAHPWVYAEALVILIGLFLITRFWKIYPVFTACAAIFVIALAPVLGLLPFTFQYYSTVADRYTYLALLGPAIGLTYALTAICRSPRAVQRASLACGTVFLLLAMQSSVQAEYWQNDYMLFSHVIETNPNSWMAVLGVGLSLEEMDEDNAATIYIERAILLAPKVAIIRSDLGTIEQKDNHTKAAIANYLKSLTLDPNNELAWCDLGSGEERLHHYNRAYAAYARAERIDPTSAYIQYCLGFVREHQGRSADAIADYRQSLKIEPDWALTHEQLGIALAQQGDLPSAITEWQTAVALDPTSIRAAILLNDVAHAPRKKGHIIFHLKTTDNTDGANGKK